jgi:hypothetical protein
MNYQLADLNAVVRSWGRGVVFRAPKWDPTTPLNLTHLGDTEGDLMVNTNAEVAILTLPELTGPAGHEGDYTGENPVIEMPLYVTDPAMRALISPGGSANAGNDRRGVVEEHTIVLFPELLWLDPVTNRVDRLKILAFAAGAWTFDAAPLSAAKLLLIDDIFWMWRAFFSRPPITFHGGAGDAKKQIETVTLQSLVHPDLPDGSKLYCIGDPADSLINIEGAS